MEQPKTKCCAAPVLYHRISDAIILFWCKDCEQILDGNGNQVGIRLAEIQDRAHMIPRFNVPLIKMLDRRNWNRIKNAAMTDHDKSIFKKRIREIRDRLDKIEQLIDEDNFVDFNEPLNSERYDLGIEVNELSRALFPFIRIQIPPRIQETNRLDELKRKERGY